MLHLATDLFDLQGYMYIILVDRYSGYTWTEKLRHADMLSICKSLTRWFTEYCWPSYIRTDGKPQSCEGNKVKHELATAYNSESNGLTEVAVKKMKSLISRCIRAI